MSACASPVLATLLIILLCILRVPMSWHTASVSSTPVWIGWVICLDSFTADMEDGKKARLIALLKSVCRLKTRPLVTLEKFMGKLNWLLALVRAFRPSLTPLYADEPSHPCPFCPDPGAVALVSL